MSENENIKILVDLEEKKSKLDEEKEKITKRIQEYTDGLINASDDEKDSLQNAIIKLREKLQNIENDSQTVQDAIDRIKGRRPMA